MPIKKPRPKKKTCKSCSNVPKKVFVPRASFNACCDVCESCFNLQICHKDGNLRNNVQGNLQILCKSCYLKTYGKNHKDKECVLYCNVSDPILIPERKHITDAGIDLKASKDYIIPSKEYVEVDCGICVEIPTGCYGMLALRSSLAKKGMLMHYGIIDSSYRGYISCFIHNFGKEPYSIKKGDRVCQLIIQPYCYVTIKKVDKLSPSERGEGGFGSSGR